MIIYNKNQISSVYSFDKELDNSYRYFEEVKGFLGFGHKNAGIYKFISFSGWKQIHHVPKHMFKIENSFYIKPRVQLNFHNGRKETIYFNSNDERDKYIKEEFYEPCWRRVKE